MQHRQHPESLIAHLEDLLAHAPEATEELACDRRAILESMRQYLQRYDGLVYDAAVRAHDLSNLATEIHLVLEHSALRQGHSDLHAAMGQRLKRLKSDLNTFQQRVKLERDLIQGKRDLASIAQQAQQPTQIELGPLLKQMRQKWPLSVVHITINLPDQPVLVCGPREPAILMLDEVIRNGIKYGSPDGTTIPRIELHLLLTAAHVVLRVISSGVPLSSEEKRRSEQTSQSIGGGSGRGVAFVRRMMQRYYQGAAGWEQTDLRSEGNCFAFFFPICTSAKPQITEAPIVIERQHPFPMRYTLLQSLTSAPPTFQALSDEGVSWLRYALRQDAHAMDQLYKEYVILAKCTSDGHPALPQLVNNGFFDGMVGAEHVRCIQFQADIETPVRLSQLLANETLDRSQASILAIANQVADLLRYLHAKKILARSLAPERFYVAETEQSFVLCLLQVDGLVCNSDHFTYNDEPRPGWDLNSAHMPLGNLHYLAPEHQGGATPDLRSDVYAFGALLYHLIWDEPPVAPLLQSAPLPAASRHLPQALIELVTRCLHPRPTQRFEDGTRLWRALQTLKQER